MTERIEPFSGNVLAHATDLPALTPAQRALANTFHGYLLASAIERLTNGGKRYFSRGTLSASTDVMQIVHQGEPLGLWRHADGKAYWTHTALTWPFVRTAIALFDERTKRGEHGPERSGGVPQSG